MWIAAIVIVVGGAIVAYVGWIEMTGRLARNAVVGIRTKATMESDEAWRAAHRTAGVWFITAGLVMTIAGMLMLVADSDAAAWGVMRIGMIGGLTFAVAGVVLADRAARRVR